GCSDLVRVVQVGRRFLHLRGVTNVVEIVTTLGQAETSARLLEDGPLLLDCQLQLGRRDLYQRPTRDHTVTNVDQHLLDLAFHSRSEEHLFETNQRSHGCDIAADLPQL